MHDLNNFSDIFQDVPFHNTKVCSDGEIPPIIEFVCVTVWFLRGIWHKYREWYVKIVHNIWGICWNIESSIYAKYSKETMLLFVYDMRLRNYSSTMRPENEENICCICCICSLPVALLAKRKCLPLKNGGLCLFQVFAFSIFFEFLSFSELNSVLGISPPSCIVRKWKHNRNSCHGN